MAFEEKRVWIGLVLAVVTYGTYVALVLVRAQSTLLVDVAYAGPLLVLLGAGILAMILVHLVIGLRARDEVGPADVRDREIQRFGERIGQSFVVIGAVAALLMAMAEWDTFWIANTIVLGFFLSAILDSVARIVAYHRGFQEW